MLSICNLDRYALAWAKTSCPLVLHNTTPLHPIQLMIDSVGERACFFWNTKSFLQSQTTNKLLQPLAGLATTGYSSFAECQGHSAKAQKHSATALPSVTLGIQHTASVCRQTAICRVFFIAHSANGLPSVKFDTRQKKKWFAECFCKKTRQRIIICRVFLGITLGKPIF